MAEIDRPLRNSPEVLARAAKSVLPDIMRWLGSGHQETDILPDLIRVLRSGGNGYELAKELDDWNPDLELVEILDGAGWDDIGAHDSVVEEWVTANSIKIELPVGVVVKTRYGIGKITERDAKLARYIVTPPDDPRFKLGGGWVIDAECCEVVPPTAPTPEPAR